MRFSITNSSDSDYNAHGSFIPAQQTVFYNTQVMSDYRVNMEGRVVHMATNGTGPFPWGNGSYGDVPQFNPGGNAGEKLLLIVWPNSIGHAAGYDGSLSNM